VNTRTAALRRFAVAITVLNILGHTLLGFEQSHAQPVFSLLTAYSVELLLEYIQSKADGRRPRFLQGGLSKFVDFLLPAHITGLAVAMLLYANDRLLPIIFAAGVAVCSKAIFSVRQEHGSRHFFNPSNFGITITLLLFPSVGIAAPYMFTEGLGPIGSVILPALMIVSGSLLNIKLTHRFPLLASWACAFVLQALVRHYLFGAQLLPVLGVMTGVAFILYTFYMVTDPATTPASRKGQVTFGLSVGLLYGVLVTLHVVFGMFFALTVVCLCRGAALAFLPHLAGKKSATRNEQPALAGVR
jgi:Na+-translocating ferredoxin:NAD+ oxidoreductase RnfD subunit